MLSRREIILRAPPSWVPRVEGARAAVYADLTNMPQRYWANSRPMPDLPTWLPATGGTFARTPAATYTDSTGYGASAATGAIRFDYDPRTLRPLGILLEPAFSNAILQSQTFANAAWTKTNVTATDNSVKAPNNTTTAALITESGGTAVHQVTQSLSQNAAAVSVYARAGTGSFLNIAVDDGNAGEYFQAIFDLSQGGITDFSTGSTGTGTNSLLAKSIEPAPDFGDGWYLCQLRGAFATPTGTVNIKFGLASAARGNTLTNLGSATYASGGKTIYLWGAQNPATQVDFYSYVPTTTVAVNGGTDILKIGCSWDDAANPMTFVMQYDTRGANADGNDIASAYYGVAQDSWQVQYTTSLGIVAYHAPTSNTTSSFTAPRPGINTIALRADTTTLTMSVNGNAVGTTAVGTARTAATNIRLGGYEASGADANAIRLRSVTAWASGLSNAALVTQSQTPGVASPTVVSTIETAAGAGSKFIDFPAFAILPSGYLLATYMKSASATQDVAPTVPTYKTSSLANALSGGSWSSAATAIANSTANIVLDITGLATLDNGTVLATVMRQNNSAHTYLLQTATATEGTAGVVSWSAATTITGSPFFTGVAGAFTGDATASPARKLASGVWMILLYGYLPADTNTSVGAIFSSTPSDPTSWGNFTTIARGNTLTPARDFSEANAIQRSNGDIVVFIREDTGPGGYWRAVCPTGSAPTTASSWRSPTFLASSSEVGMPDVVNLGNDGVMLWTRGAIGANDLIGYNVSWSAGASPFPSNRAAFGAANVEYWYSQSQMLPDGSVGTVLGQAGASSSIVFIQSVIRGVGPDATET